MILFGNKTSSIFPWNAIDGGPSSRGLSESNTVS